MTAVTEDLAQALIDAAKADTIFTNAAGAYHEANLGDEVLPYVDTLQGIAHSQDMRKTKERAVALLDIVLEKATKPKKEKKAVKEKKLKAVVYVLTYRHDWDKMVQEKVTRIYFLQRPSREELVVLFREHKLNFLDEDAWDLSRVVCGKAKVTKA